MPIPGQRQGASGPRGWSPSASTKRMIGAAIVIFALLAFIYFTSTFWVQWWWFESVGYQTALTTRYISGALAFLIAALVVGAIFAVNWQIALRRREGASKSARVSASRGLRWPLWLLTIVLGAGAGWLAAQSWVTWRLALAGQRFDINDPY